MCKNTKKSLVALIALAATLALMACVPTVDPSNPAGVEDIPYENYIIVKLAKTGEAERSLSDSAGEVEGVVNLYELVVIQLDGNADLLTNNQKGYGKVKSSFNPVTDVLTDRKARGQGSLIVPVEVGNYYGVMLLEGWRSADGSKYVLLRSSYSGTRKGENGDVDGLAIKPGANKYVLNPQAIQLGTNGNGAGAYKFDFTSADPAVTWNVFPQDGISYRDNIPNRQLPLTIQIPKRGPVMNAPAPNVPKLTIEVEGTGELFKAWLVAQGSGSDIPAAILVGDSAANPIIYPADFKLQPLVKTSGYVINSTFKSAMANPAVIFNEDYGITSLAPGAPVPTSLKLKWTLDQAMFSTQKGTGYMNFAGSYYAFSLPAADAKALKLTRWTIQNGLDNELDYEHHTGGSVFVRIDGAGDDEGDIGTVIIVEND